MGKFIWSLPGDPKAVDVSSYGDGLYRKFSPFFHNEGNKIPVPGNESIRSDSVEGIWQGLKIIGGRTDSSLFKGKPHKCKGTPAGHQFGSAVLGYIDARKQIYIPAYTYHAISNVIDDACLDLEDRLERGDVRLRDVEKNDEVENESSPLSHAAVLVDILNLLQEAPLPPFNKKRYAYLQEQLAAVLHFYELASQEKRSILENIITFAYLFSPDELKQTFALRAIQAGMPDHARIRAYTPTPVTREIFS